MVMQFADKSIVDIAAIDKRFKTFSNANFEIMNMDYSNLGYNLSITFKEVVRIKKQVAFLLNESKEVIAPVELPKLLNHPKAQKITQPVLISDLKTLICSI